MNHDRAKHLLPAYGDRQTGPVQRFFLGLHIARCPSCLAELEATQALRIALRTNLPSFRAPPSLAMRIGSTLPRETSFRARSPRRLGFVGSALGGALAGVILTLGATHMAPAPDPLIAAVVGSHVRSMMADHLTDVPTSDRHTVKPWLSARLDLSPVVKDLGAEGYPLVGGRLDYIDGRRAAAIVYRRAQHVINLFVFVSGGRLDAAPKQEARDGFNIVRWRMGGLDYVAVSDVEATQLMTFAGLVQGE